MYKPEPVLEIETYKINHEIPPGMSDLVLNNKKKILGVMLMETKPHKKNRKEEVFLSRFDIDHTRRTLIKQQQTRQACQTKYTGKHILIVCTNLAHIREAFHSTNDMKKKFQKRENNVMSFIKGMINSEESKTVHL